MTDSTKRPAFQLYPADWRKDLELQSCSIGARGLWLEMMCVMHEAKPYGHLVLNGKAMTEAQAATACRVPPNAYRKLFAELKAAGVPGESPDGVTFSRRMVRDEATREARAMGGKDGAEHGIKGKEFGKQGGRPKKDKGGEKPPLNPPPSSSSSSSSSEKTKGAFAPPEWIPAEPWNAWLEVRRKKRVPNTDEALRLTVLDLERLRAAGHEPRAALEQSIKRGYTGVFEVKADQSALALPPVSARAESCPCGVQGLVKVGGKWRCNAHIRGFEQADAGISTAAKAA